jgi:hypothetical protein
MRRFVIMVFVLILFPLSSAEARHYHHLAYRHFVRQVRVVTPPQQDFFGSFFGQQQVQSQVTRYRQVRYAGGDPRPRAWCGWYLRQKLGIADRSLNLAANWAKIGHPTNPHPGAIVVWRHHVGEITGIAASGAPIVLSGNSGHGGVTEVPRSLRGAIAFREL